MHPLLYCPLYLMSLNLGRLYSCPTAPTWASPDRMLRQMQLVGQGQLVGQRQLVGQGQLVWGGGSGSNR